MLVEVWPSKPRALNADGGINSTWAALLSNSVGPSGQVVTANTAMRVSAVQACVRVLAETLAQLPIHVYERRPNGTKRLAPEHPLNYVLQTQPNIWQTGYEFREMMMGHLALRGNAYALIVPGLRGAATELLPIHPDSVSRIVRLENGKLRYYLRNANGTEEPYAQDQIFHLRGLSFDGICGASPIAMGRDQIALGKAAEVYGSRFFANSATPDGLLSTDQVLQPEAAAKLRENWLKAHGGDGANGVAVLSGGLKWQNVGMTNTDAQFLEARKFSVTEIARLFRVPAHMINDLERATFSNIEHMGLEFVKYCMAPWLKRWEARIDVDLLVDDRYYVRFNFDGLQRGDAASRLAFYQGMVNSGIMTINEARELEDMDPVEGGDVNLVQGAMITLERCINPPEPPAPAPAVDPAAEEKQKATEKENADMRARVLSSESANGRLAAELAATQQESEARYGRNLALIDQNKLAQERIFSLEAEAESRQSELTVLQSKLSEEIRAHAEYAEQHGQQYATLLADRDKSDATCAEYVQQLSAARDSAEQLTASAVESMARWEATKLRKLAESPKGFLAAVDDYYDYAPKRFSEVISGPVSLLCLLRGEGDANAVAERCEAYLLNHRQQIVELSGKATPDNLAALVDGFVDGWKNDIQSIWANE